MNKIIVICGPDGCGKSYLAKQIMDKYPNHMYIHNAVTSDIRALHMNTVESAEIAAKHHTVLIDRLHISEYVYGTLFRNGPSYDINEIEQSLDDIDRKYHNVVKIMCIVDKDVSIEVHNSRKQSEMFDTNDKVWDMYNEYQNDTWIRYNWKTDNINLNTFEVTKKK